MQILPIHTPVIKAGHDLAKILGENFSFEDGDIVVLSSKAVATAEGAAIDMSTLKISNEAKEIAEKIRKDPHFCEAVLREIARMNGRILGDAAGVLLTELRPNALSQGTMLVPNAGLDESNIETGFAIGWPLDPVASAKKIRDSLETSKPNLAVLIGDSCVHPRRLGVTAFALAAAGIDPFRNEISKNDLFGKPLHVTVEAVADQLTVAANAVMGNAAQSIPAAVIRDHAYLITDFAGWVPGIEPSEDLFRGII